MLKPEVLLSELSNIVSFPPPQLRLGWMALVKQGAARASYRQRHVSALAKTEHLVWRWTHLAMSGRFNWWKQFAHRAAREDHKAYTATVRLDKIWHKMTHQALAKACPPGLSSK